MTTPAPPSPSTRSTRQHPAQQPAGPIPQRPLRARTSAVGAGGGVQTPSNLAGTTTPPPPPPLPLASSSNPTPLVPPAGPSTTTKLPSVPTRVMRARPAPSGSSTLTGGGLVPPQGSNPSGSAAKTSLSTPPPPPSTTNPASSSTTSKIPAVPTRTSARSAHVNAVASSSLTASPAPPASASASKLAPPPSSGPQPSSSSLTSAKTAAGQSGSKSRKNTFVDSTVYRGLDDEDKKDLVLMAVCGALKSLNNRAMFVGQLADECLARGWMSPSTNPKSDPSKLIESAIRAHHKRCGLAPDSKLPLTPPLPAATGSVVRLPLIRKHVLTGSSAERTLAAALHPSIMSSPSSTVKDRPSSTSTKPAAGETKAKKPRGSVWFLTDSAGEVDPFEREGLRATFAELYPFAEAHEEKRKEKKKVDKKKAPSKGVGGASSKKKEKGGVESGGSSTPSGGPSLVIKLKVQTTFPAPPTAVDQAQSADDDGSADSDSDSEDTSDEDEDDGTSHGETDDSDLDTSELMVVDRPTAAPSSFSRPLALPRTGFASSSVVVDENGQRVDLRSPVGPFDLSTTPNAPPPTPMEVLASLGSPLLRQSIKLHPGEDEEEERSPGKRQKTEDFRRLVDHQGDNGKPLMLSLGPTNPRMTLSFPAVLSPTASPSVPSEKFPFGHPNSSSRSDAHHPGSGSYFPHTTPSRVGSPSTTPLLLDEGVHQSARDGRSVGGRESGVTGSNADENEEDDSTFPLHLALLSSLKPLDFDGESALDRSFNREGTFDDDYNNDSVVDLLESDLAYDRTGAYFGEPSPPFEDGCVSSPDVVDDKTERWAEAVGGAVGGLVKSEPTTPPGLDDVVGGQDDEDASLVFADEDLGNPSDDGGGGGPMDEDFLGPESVGLEELERAWGGKGKKRKRVGLHGLATTAGSHVGLALMDDLAPLAAGSRSDDDVDMHAADVESGNDTDDDEDDEMDSAARVEMRLQKEAFAQALVERARSATAVMICPDLTDSDDETLVADGTVSARAIKHRRTSSLPKPLPAPCGKKEPSPLGTSPIECASSADSPSDAVVKDVGKIMMRDLVCDEELEGMEEEDDDEQAVENSVLPATEPVTFPPSPPPQPVASPAPLSPVESFSPLPTALLPLPSSPAPPLAPAPAASRPAVPAPPVALVCSPISQHNGRPASSVPVNRPPPPPHPVFSKPGQPVHPTAARPGAPSVGRPPLSSASAPSSIGPRVSSLPGIRPVAAAPNVSSFSVVYSSVPLLPLPAKAMSTIICGTQLYLVSLPPRVPDTNHRFILRRTDNDDVNLSQLVQLKGIHTIDFQLVKLLPPALQHAKTLVDWARPGDVLNGLWVPLETARIVLSSFRPSTEDNVETALAVLLKPDLRSFFPQLTPSVGPVGFAKVPNTERAIRPNLDSKAVSVPPTPVVRPPQASRSAPARAIARPAPSPALLRAAPPPRPAPATARSVSAAPVVQKQDPTLKPKPAVAVASPPAVAAPPPKPAPVSREPTLPSSLVVETPSPVKTPLSPPKTRSRTTTAPRRSARKSAAAGPP